MGYRERGSHARCVSQTGYLVHGNSKDEARGRSRHKNHSNRVVRNMGKKEPGHEEEKVSNKIKLLSSPRDASPPIID